MFPLRSLLQATRPDYLNETSTVVASMLRLYSMSSRSWETVWQRSLDINSSSGLKKNPLDPKVSMNPQSHRAHGFSHVDDVSTITRTYPKVSRNAAFTPHDPWTGCVSLTGTVRLIWPSECAGPLGFPVNCHKPSAQCAEMRLQSHPLSCRRLHGRPMSQLIFRGLEIHGIHAQ